MANKKYYHSEVIEFQNGDKTVAKQLTIKKLKALTGIFKDHDAEQRVNQKRIDEAIENAKKEAKGKIVDEEAIYEKISSEIEEEGGSTYIDALSNGCVLALNSWGVKDNREKAVSDIDIDYVEENLDFPTMSRICEIAGSMELGTKDGDDEGKA